MTTNETIISNSSYTNKDFQTIYPALLDLVKKLTYRWDPSISNESDPGVILLKLNAIIADKCNYNIDKNVLECFPLSVTQDRNARQLFEQLGYYMHWYLASKGEIVLRWIGTKDTSTTYTIPKFTMVSDDESSVVYTIIDEIPLPLDNTYVSYNALQGVAVDYSVDGSTLITSQNLDSDNRLYFEDTTVAQNGIFIRNASSMNYNEWQRKDNLSVEAVSEGARNYKFGVTLDTNICYIEFPVNAQELIGEGIYITYIRTDGHGGNVAPFTISKFYQDLVIDTGDDTSVTLDSTNVQIANYGSIVSGEDPETIDDAYANYKKIVGTFDTLVTLRDYTNAIRQYELASNGFACDKIDDIDLDVDLMKVVNGIDQRVSMPMTLNDESGVGVFPFDLKFYMLYAKDQYSDIVNDGMFNNTFRLLDDIDLENGTSFAENALAYIGTEKAVQQNLHTPTSLGSYDSNGYTVYTYPYGNSICFIKNYYPISGTIIPQYQLTSTQAAEIQSNIKAALYNNFNAKKVEFGEEINYDTVHSIIMNSDERIKSVILDDLNYQTYAVYLKINEDPENVFTPEFVEVRIDEVDEYNSALSRALRTEILTRNILAGKTPLYIIDDEYPRQYMNQESPYTEGTKLASDVTRIEMGGSLTRTAGGTKTYIYNVDPNAAVRFIAPNLISIDEYGSYVKYEYNLTNGISSDSDYQLNGDEYVAFYWTGDEDSGYNYCVYGAGTIIHPTFTMSSGVTPSGLGGLPAVLSNALSATSEPKSISGVTYELPDSIESIEQHITSLSSYGMVLSSSQTITIKHKNEVVLGDTYYCSWILNNIEDGRCVLFDENESEYILKSGEYFIYTNAEKSSLVVLGQGTKLSRDTTSWSTEWACNSYDYSSVVSDGINGLLEEDGALQTIPVGNTLTVTEMQIISVPEGGKVKLVITGDTAPSIDIGTTTTLSISDYSEIAYQGPNDTSYTPLPVITLSGDSWVLECDGIINLEQNVPKYIPQLSLYHKVLANWIEYETGGSIFVSNKSVYGENSILLTEPIKVTSYSVATNTDSVTYSEDGKTITVEAESGGTSSDEPVYGSAVSFDVPIINHKMYTLKVDVSGIPTTDNIFFKITGFGGDKEVHSGYVVSFAEMPVQTGGIGDHSMMYTTLGIQVGGGASGESYAVALSDLVCVDFYFEDEGGTLESAIRNKIDDLKYRAVNPDEFNFDYTYQVEDDELVENPLSANSFWDYNHEYNKFTIGQMQTDTIDDLKILSKSR